MPSALNTTVAVPAKSAEPSDARRVACSSPEIVPATADTEPLTTVASTPNSVSVPENEVVQFSESV